MIILTQNDPTTLRNYFEQFKHFLDLLLMDFSLSQG